MSAIVNPDSTMQSTLQSLSCCSAFYELDWVRLLAEDIFHPGGKELTNKTIAAMNLPAGAAIADLGCGTGTTAIMLERYYDFRVSAVDISAANIERAVQRMGRNRAAVRFFRATGKQATMGTKYPGLGVLGKEYGWKQREAEAMLYPYFQGLFSKLFMEDDSPDTNLPHVIRHTVDDIDD